MARGHAAVVLFMVHATIAIVDGQRAQAPTVPRNQDATHATIGMAVIGRTTSAPTQPPTEWSSRIRTRCADGVEQMFVRLSERSCMRCDQLALLRSQQNPQDESSCRTQFGDYCSSDGSTLACPRECWSDEFVRYRTLGDCMTAQPPSSSLLGGPPPPPPPPPLVQSENASRDLANETNDSVVQPVSVYRQSLSTAEAYLGSSYNELIREVHVARGPPGGPRLIIRFELLTRNYTNNATIDTVHGAAGDGNMHSYVSVGANGSTTKIALYPSQYTFLGPQVLAAGIYDDGAGGGGGRRERRQTGGGGGCNFTVNSSAVVTFSLTPDAPPGFWARPDTGEIMVAILPAAGSVVGNVSFGLRAHYPGFEPVTLHTFNFFIQPRDIDNWGYGPGSQGCLNGGQPVDYTEFDHNYTCNCTGTFHAGGNCETREIITATGLVDGGGPWNHGRREWAADKTYIIDPPTMERIFLMPSNTTVDPTSTWWELRCAWTTFANGTRVNTSEPPYGVYIDTVTGRLSVSFVDEDDAHEDQVGNTYGGCQLRLFITRQNYFPMVVKNMTFVVRDSDFGKYHLMVTGPIFQNMSNPDYYESHSRENWTVGVPYHVAPLIFNSSSFGFWSNDTNTTVPLHEDDMDDLSFVLRPLPEGFFVQTTTGEMFGQLKHVSRMQSSLKVTHPSYLEGTITTITFNALLADTETASNGPNGQDCDIPTQRVDTIPYDNSFSCNCSGYLRGGDNCMTALARAGEGAKNDTSNSIIIPVSIGMVLLFLVCFAYKYYKKHKAYIEMMKPENFERHLQKLAEAGIIKKVDQNRPPRELERKRVILECQLGSGNFGEVWRGILMDDKKSTYATKNSLARTASSLDSLKIPVAVKTLKNGDNIAGQEEFLREASVTWQFDHENVVRMFGVVTSGTPYLLVLELCSLGELKGYLEKGDVDDPDHYSLGRLFNFLVGIAEGMKHLSDLGFVHRDLAARNVLVSDTYDAKICDFGLGRETSEDSDYYRSNDANMLVPIRWTDPDVLGTGKFSEYTDVWAYGITAIEIFTRGQTPYRGWLNTYIIEQTKQGYRMPCPEGCPSEVYNNVIFPCWLSCDEKASPRRPNFSILCAELKRIGSKIDPRRMTVASVTPIGADDKSWKKNRAYTSTSGKTDASEYHEYSQAGSMGGSSSEYDYQRNLSSGGSHYEYAEHASPASTLEKKGDASNSDSGFSGFSDVVNNTYEIPVPLNGRAEQNNVGDEFGEEPPRSPRSSAGSFHSLYSPRRSIQFDATTDDVGSRPASDDDHGHGTAAPSSSSASAAKDETTSVGSGPTPAGSTEVEGSSAPSSFVSGPGRMYSPMQLRGATGSNQSDPPAPASSLSQPDAHPEPAPLSESAKKVVNKYVASSTKGKKQKAPVVAVARKPSGVYGFEGGDTDAPQPAAASTDESFGFGGALLEEPSQEGDGYLETGPL